MKPSRLHPSNLLQHHPTKLEMLLASKLRASLPGLSYLFPLLS